MTNMLPKRILRTYPKHILLTAGKAQKQQPSCFTFFQNKRTWEDCLLSTKLCYNRRQQFVLYQVEQVVLSLATTAKAKANAEFSSNRVQCTVSRYHVCHNCVQTKFSSFYGYQAPLALYLATVWVTLETKFL